MIQDLHTAGQAGVQVSQAVGRMENRSAKDSRGATKVGNFVPLVMDLDIS